jgi:hypothetical protein
LSGTLTNDGYVGISGVWDMAFDTLVNHGLVGIDGTGRSATPGLPDPLPGDPPVEGPGSNPASGGSSSGGSSSGSSGGGSSGDPTAPAASAGPVQGATQLRIGSWYNDGVIKVDPGTILDIACPPPSGPDTLTQAGGSIIAGATDGLDGPGGHATILIDGGQLHYSGGSIAGDFVVRDGAIRVEGSVTAPTALRGRSWSSAGSSATAPAGSSRWTCRPGTAARGGSS